MSASDSNQAADSNSVQLFAPILYVPQLIYGLVGKTKTLVKQKIVKCYAMQFNYNFNKNSGNLSVDQTWHGQKMFPVVDRAWELWIASWERQAL